MIDKELLVNKLEKMIDDRSKLPKHMDFYSNPQNIGLDAILFMIKSGSFDAKEKEPEDRKDPATKTYGCWNPSF